MSPKTVDRAPDPALFARPRLAGDVQVHEPSGEGAPWVVQRSGPKYFRVESDLARLMRVMDGARDHAELAAALGQPWAAEDVSGAVAKLSAGGLLADGTVRKTRTRRVVFVPPLTVQFTLLKPGWLTRLAPLLRLPANRAGAVLAAIPGFGGLVALALLMPEVKAALGHPLAPGVYLGLIGGLLVTTALHELGHGAVLTYYGGRPSRMGVMLFYLAPAFFCDVSDGWRLPRTDQRVRVALAGIVTQSVIAGAAAVTALFLDPSPGRDGVLLFAVLAYTTGALNLVPFVKLDGYLALMSHLDLPHLRARTMTDARRFLARVLFGGRYARELPQRWSVGFGLACMAFPLYLVGSAMVLWAPLFQGLGMLGASVLGFGACYLVYRFWKAFSGLIGLAHKAGARIWRIIAGTSAVAVALAAPLLFVTVPYTVTGGYVAQHGRVELVLPATADQDAGRPGSAVRLYRAGVVNREQVAAATVAGPRAKECSAPFSAFAPMRTDVISLPCLGYELTAPRGSLEPTGAAELDAGRLPLWNWLYAKYLAPAGRW
ncbi:hypothetical protein OG943_09125 [Amycolatopsis sp. NBC_00345]|uniref:daptide biosynthesis intramembrane metalloprotease n=1 Tax=Amycolatopsis sp. NBC_00345 TaxID=2975955 RepID=UPI002E262D0E